MALVKCKECGNDVATSAKACPKCGHKMPARTSLLTWIILGFVILIVIGAVQGSQDADEQREAREQAAAQSRRAEAAELKRIATLPPEEKAKLEKELADRKAAVELAARNAQGLAWTYAESKDAMSDAAVRTATISSMNQIEFHFPYQGLQRAALQLRAHPRHGKDVILRIAKGQFNCRVDDCEVKVRFGDGKAQAWRMLQPEDHSTTALFFDEEARFVSNLRKASTVRVEAPFFQSGNRVFEFRVDGLEWK